MMRRNLVKEGSPVDAAERFTDPLGVKDYAVDCSGTSFDKTQAETCQLCHRPNYPLLPSPGFLFAGHETSRRFDWSRRNRTEPRKAIAYSISSTALIGRLRFFCAVAPGKSRAGSTRLSYLPAQSGKNRPRIKAKNDERRRLRYRGWYAHRLRAVALDPSPCLYGVGNGYIGWPGISDCP
jgi:hypothetical protein